MTGYAFAFGSGVFTPDGRADIPDVDAHNKALEASELDAWSQKPDYFAVYVSNDRTVSTWLGTTIGRVVSLSSYRNNLGARIDCLTVQGTNGATYHGRYGSDWSQLVHLHRSK